MEIYLIRHTAPKVEKGICYGQTDLELADTCNEEIENVLKQLPKQFDVVYSSPLKRCTQLAKAIDASYKTDKRLMELNFGDWELKKWKIIPLFKIQPWYDDYVNTPCLNGESYSQLSNRVIRFCKSIENLEYDKIAVVTHAGVIRSIVSHCNNFDLKDSFDEVKIPYGDVKIILV